MKKIIILSAATFILAATVNAHTTGPRLKRIISAKGRNCR